jgi:hypothetical protein
MILDMFVSRKGEVMDKENSYAASTQMSRLAFSAVDGNS